MKFRVILHSFIYSFANILIILSGGYQVHQNIFCPLPLTSVSAGRGWETSCCVATLANIPYKPKYLEPRYRPGAATLPWWGLKGVGINMVNTCNYCLSLLAAHYVSSQLIKIIAIIAGGAGTTSHLASELMTLYSWPNRKPQQCCSLDHQTILPPSPWQISISLTSQLGNSDIKTSNLPEWGFCSQQQWGFIIHFSEFIKIFISLVVSGLDKWKYSYNFISHFHRKIFSSSLKSFSYFAAPIPMFSIPSFFLITPLIVIRNLLSPNELNHSKLKWQVEFRTTNQRQTGGKVPRDRLKPRNRWEWGWYILLE